jgi:hypothetical protein
MREISATNARFIQKKQAVRVVLMTSNSAVKWCVETRYFLRNYLPMPVSLMQELATYFDR